MRAALLSQLKIKQSLVYRIEVIREYCQPKQKDQTKNRVQEKRNKAPNTVRAQIIVEKYQTDDFQVIP